MMLFGVATLKLMIRLRANELRVCLHVLRQTDSLLATRLPHMDGGILYSLGYQL